MKLLVSEMKPVFGIDVTADKKNETLNGMLFVTQSAPQDKIKEYEKRKERLDETVKKSKFPLWLRIVQYVLMLYAMICFVAVIRAGFSTAMENAPYIVVSGIISAMVWLTMFIIAKLKEKSVLKEENAQQQIDKISNDAKLIQSEMNVPTNAPKIDILTFRYKVKNGEMRFYESGLQVAPFINVEVKIYTEGDKIHIADLGNVYTFDKSELQSIIRINKRTSITSWNKLENPLSDKYKKYKLTVNNMGAVFMNQYYVLTLERNGEKYGIFFPCYELEIFELASALKAQDPEK